MKYESPPSCLLKFNVDVRQKGSAAGIGCVLWNHNGELLFMFCKHVGLKESTKAEILVVL